jgi:membrane-associated phospholipid phosphatase
MLKKLISFLLTVFVFTSKAYSWDLKSFKEEAASPYTTNARYVLYTGTAVTVGILIFEDAISDPFQVKQARNKTLGSSSKYGDMLGQLIPNILYTAGMGIAGYYNDPKGYDRALGMFKATAYASSVTTVLKYAAREPRPYDHKVKNSFPSGHTTTAFAFSGYVAAEHGWAWGVPALLMSTFIGYSRINDNRHWLHDVTAGATIGWVYGWGIAKLGQQKKKEEREKEKSEGSASIVPIYDSKTVGLALFREF